MTVDKELLLRRIWICPACDKISRWQQMYKTPHCPHCDGRIALTELTRTDKEADYKHPDMEYWAEEYECAMMFLDDLKVPRHVEEGVSYSLVGRITEIRTRNDKAVEIAEVVEVLTLVYSYFYLGAIGDHKAIGQRTRALIAELEKAT